MAEDYSVRAVLSAYDAGFSSAMQGAARQTSALGGSIGSTLKSSALFTVGMKAASAGVSALTSHIGSAVKRVDTLNQFPKVMKQLGFTTKDASDAMDKLSKGIDGLPTSLDEIVSSAQSIALITGDLDKASDTAIALNNAFLSSGSSAYDASRGLTQYTQMLSAGKVDMQSWGTLLDTMGPALNTVAEAFGYTGAKAKSELYSALQDGTITFDQLNEKMIELNEGTNGFASRAVTASAGIQTSFQNIGTTVTKGLANSINAIDKALAFIKHPKSGLTGFAGIADYVKDRINSAFNAIAGDAGLLQKIDFKGMIEGAAPYWNAFSTAVSGVASMLLKLTGFIGQNAKAISVLSGPVIGLVAAFKGLNAVPGIIKGVQNALGAATSACRIFTGAMNAGEIAEDAGKMTKVWADFASKGRASIDAVKGAVGKLTSAWSEASRVIAEQGRVSTINRLYGESARTMGIYSSATSRATGLTKVFTAVQKGLNLVLKANPIVLVISLIAGLIVALGALQASGRNVVGAINGFTEQVIAKINSISTALPAVINSLVTSIVENMPSLINAGVQMIQALADGLVKSIPVLVAAAPSIVKALVKGIISVVGALLSAGIQLIQALIQGISNMLPSLKSAAVSIAKNIPKWIKGALKGLAAIGASVVTGLWNGMSNKVGWIKSKISGFVGNVKSWLKKFFKIGSPSKLMAKEIGQYLPMGIAEGFDKKSSSVMKSAKNLAMQVANVPFTTPTVQSAYAGGLTDSYSYSQSIEVPLYINSREFARATASDVQSVLNTRQTRANRQKGVL